MRPTFRARSAASRVSFVGAGAFAPERSAGAAGAGSGAAAGGPASATLAKTQEWSAAADNSGGLSG